jgi:mRNA interferase HigB
VFNIAGNNFRLLTYVCFRTRSIFLKEFLTHAEYDGDFWKERLNYDV